MTDRPETHLTRIGDRTVSWSEYGDRAGIPMFQLHGVPGSRFQRHFDGSLYVKAGFRTVCFDRPGYGQSTRARGRSIADLANDIAALADALGIGRFAICGWSGGAAFALAATATLGDRVLACHAIVPSAPPTPDLDPFAGLDEETTAEIAAARAGEGPALEHFTRVADAWLKALADGGLPFPAPPPAVPIARQWMPEAFAQGPFGAADDALAIVRDWGSDLAKIRARTVVWSAEDDTCCPIAHGEWLARHIPGAELVRGDGGHLGFLPVYGDILGQLRRNVDAANAAA